MTNPQLVLNTIVFKDLLDQGIPQKDLLQNTKALGINNMEVRREFLTDPATDLPAIHAAAQALDMGLLYSINDDFVINGQVNPLLGSYIDEALTLEAKVLKLNTGDATGLTADSLKAVAPLLDTTVKVSVENNQTPHHATIANIRQFLDLVKMAELPIRFVFDTGNWYWIGDTAPEALATFKAETHYIHLKNCQVTNGQTSLTSLFTGDLDIASLIKDFNTPDFYAFEYPCSPETLADDIATFKAALN